MLKALRSFLKSPQPRRDEALLGLRLLFAGAFMGQLLLAGLTGGLLLLITSPQTSSSPVMAQVMVAMSLLQLPLALSLAYLSAKGGTKSSALSAVIVLGVLLSAPAWFALFALLTGAAARHLLIMMLILMSYYLLGFILSGLFIHQAMMPDEQREAQRGEVNEGRKAPQGKV